MMDFRDNVQKSHEYIQALEHERRKIQVFQRELPLCLELVTQAIETCKQQLVGSGMGTSNTTTAECLNGHSECSEQTTTSSDGPVLEEFIPIKKSNSTEDEHEEEESSKKLLGKKSDWLRSVQLWNPDPHSAPEVHEHQPKRVSVVEVKKNNGGAFHPFHKEIKGSSEINNNNNNNNKPTSSVSACSSAEAAVAVAVAGGKKEEKGGSQADRKARRCWSPELHRRFLHALQQLGGSHVATPKQIRELMKVDGLTNDEVKSHLQKYRLHTRRPSASASHHSNSNPQTAQFVVVGGIWMPPSEYQATVGAPSSSPQKKQSRPSEERRSPNTPTTPSDGGVHSHSPVTSTGSHHAY